MLGLSSQRLEYQTINDFHSPSDYLEYMFGFMQGVVYRVTLNPEYHHNFYRASGLIKARYNHVDNCYVSMNTFYRTKGLDEQKGRDVEHIKRLNALYVDIDCYKLGLTKKEVLMCLEDDFIGSKIPVPTFIIDSGRGIYLVWKLRNEDKKALPRWTAVQQYLTDALKELGADQACTDAARILRVPFTYNPKSNSVVTIKEFHDLTYSLYDIAKEYDVSVKKTRTYTFNSKENKKKYPYNHATERQRKYVRDIAKRLGLSEEAYPDFTNFHETDNWIKLHKDFSVSHGEEKDYCYKKGNIYSMKEFKSIKSVLGLYCSEIKKLFSMRKGADCKRELALFLYRYFLREMKYDSENALKETLIFNASLDCPFDETYVSVVTSSADRRIEKGIPYAYKKSTIINILEITKEELTELPFFASDVKEKKERRKENNRRAYENRLHAEGKEAKKEAILKRRASILAMQEQGKTATEIQKELQISRATYHRDVAALAVKSVLEAVKSVLSEKVENIAEQAEKAVKAVSDTLKGMNKKDSTHTLLSAVRNLTTFRLSHFLSTPFIEMYSVAVPHSPVYSQARVKHVHWMVCKRRKDSKDTDSEGDSDSSAS